MYLIISMLSTISRTNLLKFIAYCQLSIGRGWIFYSFFYFICNNLLNMLDMNPLFFMLWIYSPCLMIIFSFSQSVSQFSRSVVSNSSRPHGLLQARPPCPSPTPGVYSDSCQLSQWCHPTISTKVVQHVAYKYKTY